MCFLYTGISSVKSAPVRAFLTSKKVARTFYSKLKSRENGNEISLSSLEVIAGSLLDILQVGHVTIIYLI